MRRVVLFLLLFGAGLTILILIQGKQTEEELPETPPEVDGPIDPEIPIEIPDQGALFTSRGPIRHAEGRPRRFSLTASDHHALEEGTFQLHDIALELYDTESGALSSEITARLGRLRLDFAGEGDFAIDEKYENMLEDVDLEIRSGLPLVPVTTHLPEASFRLEDRQLHSGSDVLLLGRGLRTTSEGVVVEGLTNTLRLLRNPTVHMRLEDGTRVQLRAAGELQIRAREDLGPGGLSLIARDGVRLDFMGEVPRALEASEIRLFGRVTENTEGDDSFAPSRVEAEGDVVFHADDGAFSGREAELTFSEDGHPASAVLRGAPRVELELQDLDPEDLPAGVSIEGGALPVTVTGDGPLTVGLGEPASFDFVGPVHLDLPSVGATLDAGGTVSGIRDAVRNAFVVLATGGVVVAHQDATLEAPEIEIGTYPGPDGRPGAKLTAAGRTRTVGALEDGRAFTLDTTNGIELVRRDEDYKVPRAGGVDLVVEGEGGFRARADRVTDFDATDLTFLAEGNVLVENAEGVGRGHRLESLGPERVRFAGSPGPQGAPAHFEFPEGSVWGDLVEVDGDLADARGNVRAEFGAQDARYQLSSRWAHLDRSGHFEGDPVDGLIVLDAGGDARARLGGSGPVEWSAAVNADLVRVRARMPPRNEAGGEAGGLQPLSALASGNLTFSYDGELSVEGEGGTLEIDREGVGRLDPRPGERCRIEGELPFEDLRFKMTCDGVTFSPERMEAGGPDLEVLGVQLPVPGEPAGEPDLAPGSRVRSVAGHMVADRRSLLLTEGVYIGQVSPDEPSWSLDADKVLITGTLPEEGEETGDPVERFHDLLAWGGFVARFGDRLHASGDSMQLIRATEVIKMSGSPAVMVTSGYNWRADWFEMNMRTSFVRAGRGRVAAAAPGEEGWTLSYTSVEPVEGPYETIQVVREPVIVSGDEMLRASWALFWVDTREWAQISGEAMGRDGPAAVPDPAEISDRPPPHEQSLFGMLKQAGVGNWLREVYVEGNVHYTIKGEHRARADSIYLDLIDGHGWIRKFDMALELPYIRDGLRLKLRARAMLHSADGSSVAQRAVATTCEFEEPHYEIRIGDLVLEPRTKERPRRKKEPGEGDTIVEPDGWRVSSKGTALDLFGRLKLPLPPLGVPVDEDGNVESKRISMGGLHPFHFGQDSKLGSFIGTTVSRDLSWFAKGFHRLISGPNARFIELDGGTDYRADYLGARGLLLGLTSELDAEQYDLEINVDGLLDDGDDRGLVRVDPSDRDDWRAWYRARGRYLLGDSEWLDLVVTHQTDPGVQSEFFESEYLEFEERESYLHWRRAEGEDYFKATAEVQLDDFRTEVVEQPSLGHFRGRTQIGEFVGIPLQYTSGTTLANLDRIEGDPLYEAPYLDGFGEEQALRFDTSHRIETPFSLGALGMRATPFLEARGTAWEIDEATNPALVTSAEDPTRVGLLGGVEVGTTFWRTFSGATRHVLAPFIGWRTDLVVDESDDPLVHFDQVENPIEGQFFDLGLRTRVTNKRTGNFFDLELVETHASSVAVGQADGWLPLQIHGSWLTEFLSMGFAFQHDSRYDLENSATPYSRTLIGWEPWEPIQVEGGYHSARDLAGSSIYSALSLRGRYKFSKKWEIEGGYVQSTQGDGRLASELGVRRFGHDFVFEVSTRFRAGEGGTSFQFDIIPLLSYKEPREGLVRRWRRGQD